MIYDEEDDILINVTDIVYIGSGPYWDPGALAWNNKPNLPPETFHRTSYIHDTVEGYPTNECFTEHWIDISEQVLAAIAAPSPFLTIIHHPTPPLPDHSFYSGGEWELTDAEGTGGPVIILW